MSKSLPIHSRIVACEVITRVLRDRAHVAPTLDTELQRAIQLDTRDCAFVTELVYGTLRVWLSLEQRLENAAPRGLRKLDYFVRSVLMVGAYQILYTKVPVFAAVHVAVEIINKNRGRTLGGFANALLRKVADAATTDPVSPAAVDAYASLPVWLRKAFEQTLGADSPRFLLEADIPPPTVIRCRIDRDHVAQMFEPFHGKCKPGSAPSSLRLSGFGKIANLPGFSEGNWVIQEEGAQWVGALVGARAGDKVLDACAGRGNKSLQILDATANGVELHAADVFGKKLDTLRQEHARLHGDCEASITCHEVDLTVGTGSIPIAHFDRVLLDAPCSGVGTIARRPEIVLHRTEDDIKELQKQQIRIASTLIPTLKIGGRLLYSTCSILREECEDVVDDLIATNPGLSRAPFDSEAAKRLQIRDSDCVRLLPYVHGTDGYFVASFVRHA